MAYKVISTFVLFASVAHHAEGQSDEVTKRGYDTDMAKFAHVGAVSRSPLVVTKPGFPVTPINEIATRANAPLKPHSVPTVMLKTVADLEEKNQELEIVYKRLRARMKKSPAASLEDSTHRFGLGVFEGLIAFVGLATSIGVAAAGRYLGRGPQDTELRTDSQIYLVPTSVGPIAASAVRGGDVHMEALNQSTPPSWSQPNAEEVNPSETSGTETDAANALHQDGGGASVELEMLDSAETDDTPDIEAESNLLGQVISIEDADLIVVKSEVTAEEPAQVGALMEFDRGEIGVIVAERCGFYFAAPIDGLLPQVSDSAVRLSRNLSVPAWDEDAGAAWGGLHDYMGVPSDAPPPPPDAPTADVFQKPVPAAGRRPINSSLHTGVVAIDALAPIGRGQSMMLFGPDGLPAGSGRTDLALRVLEAQRLLKTDIKSILVLSGTEEERAATLTSLRESGSLDSIKVLVATTPNEGVIAASAACSIAQSCQDEDVLVVVDSLRPLYHLWKTTCDVIETQGVPVTWSEEGSQLRDFYHRLVERAARRKDGGSVTLILLQPSVSMLPPDSAKKEAYTLSDFEAAGFTNKVCTRVKLLEEKGVSLTQDVLVKVGIPLPGSEHPVAGRGQRSAQHLEELTSLVDGHIDLRETLAFKGRVPPIDLTNSVSRIGVGQAKVRPTAQTAAMAAVSSGLRCELAQAMDSDNVYIPENVREKQARRDAALMAVLHQPDPQPLTLGEETALLLAASTGALDEPVALAGEAGTAEILRDLLAHISSHGDGLLARISDVGLVGDAATERLGELTKDFFKQG